MIEVGQTVWVVSKGHRNRDPETINERIVASVGRKYFTLQGNHVGRKYRLDTLQEVSEFGSPSRVYTSLTEIFDKQERESLEGEIRSAFRCYGKTKFTLQQLRDVALTLELTAHGHKTEKG